MDSLKDYLYTMQSCNSCGQCRFILGPKMRGWEYAEICPIHLRYKFDAFSGQGLINIAQELLEGRLSWDEELVNHIFTCTACGACDINCKSIRDMEVLDAILALRAKCVEEGHGPLPVHREYALNVESCHNIYGLPHEARSDWITSEVKTVGNCGTAYFAGCSTAYRHPDIATNIARILKAGGQDFSVLPGEEYCCGAPLWRTGQREAAVRLAEHNMEVFKRRGIKTLITGCAECYGTFRGFYPRIATPEFQVLHISEVIDRMLTEGRLKLTGNLKIKATYHDPCLLGRLSEPYVPWNGVIKPYGLHDPPKQWRRGTNGVYEAPRRILKAIPGLTLVEMIRNEENSFCCGGGGGVLDAFPDFALWTARERITEARSTGAEALVSCCPFCQSGFEKALKQEKGGLKYYDLTGLVVRAL